MTRQDKWAQRLAELTQIEGPLWAQGKVFAGMDEVGRGPLCGPVVAACVIMPAHPLILGVDDSKKLSPARRELLYHQICQTACFVGVGMVEAGDIDAINILQATKRAMEQAAAQAPCDLFLIDAVDGLNLPGEIRAIIGGDRVSYSIAAASIVAKVTRDRLMQTLDATYPGYGLAHNMGYGTAQHIDALGKLGPTPIHRRSFIGKFVAL